MTFRHRQRWLQRSMSKLEYSQISGPIVAPPAPYNGHADTIFEDMTDEVSIPWPPRSKVVEKLTRWGIQKSVFPAIAPINYLLKTTRNRFESPGSMTIKDGSGGSRVRTYKGPIIQWMGSSPGGFGQWPGGVITALPAGYNLSGLIQLAKQRAIANFDKPDQAFGESIAESMATVRLIADPLQEVVNHVGRFERLVQKAKRFAKTWTPKKAAAIWAISSFAILPAVQDCYNVSELLAKNLLDISIATFKVKGGRSQFKNSLQSQTGAFTSNGWIVSGSTTRLLNVDVHAGVISQIHDPNAFAGKVGTRVRDIPGVLWNILPLSFVIDRFVNVSRVINAATSLTSLDVKIVGGYLVVYVRDSSTYHIGSITAFSGGGTSKWTLSGPTRYQDELITVERTKWNPNMGDVIPDTNMFGAGFVDTLQKTLDAISLGILVPLRRHQ